MTDKKYFGELAIADSDSAIETVAAMPYTGPSGKIHHTRISAKFDDESQETLSAIAIRHFVDEETPHYKFGIEFEPGKLDDVIDGLEMLRLEHMR